MNLIRRNANSWSDPFSLIADLHEDLNRAFTGSLRRTRDRDWVTNFFNPEIEITENNDQYTLKVDLPGVTKDEVQLQFTGHTLEIRGERKEEKKNQEKGLYHSELRYGSFSRVIEFPEEVQSDQAKASYKNGVLELTVPKSEKAKPKQIKIDVN